MKKLAVVYAGYHFGSYTKSSSSLDRKRDVDYRRVYSNHKERIFDYFHNAGYEVDVFVSTYNSTILDQFLRDIKPISYNIVDDDDHHISGRKGNMVSATKLVEDHCKKLASDNQPLYDCVLYTRPDLYIRKDLSAFDIDLNGFNVSFLTQNGVLLDDFINFTLFNFKYFDKFKNSIYTPLKGGNPNHVNKLQMEKNIGVKINLMVKDWAYKVDKGFVVHLNPLYIMTSKVGDYWCFFCAWLKHNKYELTTLKCGHRFHSHCLKGLPCPLCDMGNDMGASYCHYILEDEEPEMNAFK